MHQDIARQKKEQQHPLKDPGHRDGQPQFDLCRLAPDVTERHQQRRQQNAHGVQSSQEGNDDRGEPIAGRDRRRQLPDRPGHLDGAGQTGKRPTDQQGRPNDPATAEPGIPRGRRRQAHHLDLKSEQAARNDEPGGGDSDQGQREADMHAGSVQQDRQNGPFPEQPGLREAEPHRVLPGAGHQIAEQQPGHIGQHQTDQNLIRVESGPQKCRDRGPKRAADHPADQHRRQQQRPFLAIERQGQTAAENRAEGQLPFRPDIPDIGPEPKGEADRNHGQGRRLDRQFAQAVLIRQRQDEIGVQRVRRIETQKSEKDGPAQDRQEDGQQRRRIKPDLRRFRAAIQCDHDAASNNPPINSPTSSAVVAWVGRLSDRWPSKMTATRSEIMNNSSRS